MSIMLMLSHHFLNFMRSFIHQEATWILFIHLLLLYLLILPNGADWTLVFYWAHFEAAEQHENQLLFTSLRRRFLWASVCPSERFKGWNKRVCADVDVHVLLAAASLDRAGGDVRQHHEIFMLIVCKLNRSPPFAQITPALISTANRWWSDDRGRSDHRKYNFFFLLNDWFERIKILCGFNKLSISVTHQPTFHAELYHSYLSINGLCVTLRDAGCMATIAAWKPLWDFSGHG